MRIRAEYAVGLGITTGLIFMTGVGYGAELLTQGEALMAGMISVILGFTPVSTLIRPPSRRDIGQS